MTASFIPMDTPHQPPAAEGESGLPQVCPPAAAPSPEEVDPGSATTANLRAGLASRLRSAYEQGAQLDDLASACHQPVTEVRELLQQAGVNPDEPAVSGDVGAGAGAGAGATGAVPQQRDGGAESPAGPGAWSSSGPRPRPRVRRPAPVRRVPRTGRERPAAPTAPTDQVGPAVESTVGPAVEPAELPASTVIEALDVTAPPAPTEQRTEASSAPDRPTGTAGAGQPSGLEPQLGILIGGGQRSPEPPTQTSDQRRRVRAQVLRVGRGTTLTLLPSWRSSIAVSVPTELLMAATGLSHQELPGAELSVVINPDALHDRELRPSDWQAGPIPPTPRRQRD